MCDVNVEAICRHSFMSFSARGEYRVDIKAPPPFVSGQSRSVMEIWKWPCGFSWLLDSGFQILDSGFWILDSGFWILDSGFWICLGRDSGFVIRDSWFVMGDSGLGIGDSGLGISIGWGFLSRVINGQRSTEQHNTSTSPPSIQQLQGLGATFANVTLTWRSELFYSEATCSGVRGNF